MPKVANKTKSTNNFLGLPTAAPSLNKGMSVGVQLKSTSLFTQDATSSAKETAVKRQKSLNPGKIRKLSKRFTDELDLDENEMEKLIRYNIKHSYISSKPKKQQLYFLFKLILNRRSF